MYSWWRFGEPRTVAKSTFFSKGGWKLVTLLAVCARSSKCLTAILALARGWTSVKRAFYWLLSETETVEGEENVFMDRTRVKTSCKSEERNVK